MVNSQDVNRTKVGHTKEGLRTLRTTIPLHIIDKLGIKNGSYIKWDLDKDKSNKWFCTLQKE